jgi:hypothetical protein
MNRDGVSEIWRKSFSPRVYFGWKKNVIAEFVDAAVQAGMV